MSLKHSKGQGFNHRWLRTSLSPPAGTVPGWALLLRCETQVASLFASPAWAHTSCSWSIPSPIASVLIPFFCESSPTLLINFGLFKTPYLISLMCLDASEPPRTIFSHKLISIYKNMEANIVHWVSAAGILCQLLNNCLSVPRPSFISAPWCWSWDSANHIPNQASCFVMLVCASRGH